MKKTVITAAALSLFLVGALGANVLSVGADSAPDTKCQKILEKYSKERGEACFALKRTLGEK